MDGGAEWRAGIRWEDERVESLQLYGSLCRSQMTARLLNPGSFTNSTNTYCHLLFPRSN